MQPQNKLNPNYWSTSKCWIVYSPNLTHTKVASCCTETSVQLFICQTWYMSDCIQQESTCVWEANFPSPLPCEWQWRMVQWWIV